MHFIKGLNHPEFAILLYEWNNKFIVKFDREDQLDDTLIVFLPAKNSALFPDNETQSTIPEAVVVNIGGRVNSDTDCIANLTFT